MTRPPNTAASLASWVRKAREAKTRQAQAEATLTAARADELQALARRDDLIRQLRAEGATLQAIADIVGMTVPGVRKVLDRA